MKNNKLKNLSYKNKGFTIIELIISIFVLSIAVVGIFNALSVITILTADSADRLTATYLAQEGMEIVRNIRDTNWLYMDAASAGEQPYSWDNGLVEKGLPNGPGCTNLNPCKADYKSENLVNGTDYLQLNANGFYVYGADLAQTKFKRRIIIESIPDVDNIISPYHILKVKVEVSWDKKATTLNAGVFADECGQYNCITTQGTLYNWYNTNILVAGVEITSDAELNNVIPTAGVIEINSNQTNQLYAKTNPLNATNQEISWSAVDDDDIVNNSCIVVSNTGIVSPIGPSCEMWAKVTTADGGHWYKVKFNVTHVN